LDLPAIVVDISGLLLPQDDGGAASPAMECVSLLGLILQFGKFMPWAWMPQGVFPKANRNAVEERGTRMSF